MAALRRLTPKGIEEFRAMLRSLRRGEAQDLETAVLASPENSEVVTPLIEIVATPFVTKRAAAEYLVDRLRPLARKEDVLSDGGVWSWLAAFYFASVSPKVNGKRKLLADPHYILEADDYTRRYRHLLATPYRILLEIPDHNRIYLDAPLSVHGDLVEQTMSKMYLLRVPAVRAVIEQLYFDAETGKAKRGILPQKKAMKPGDLRNRFPLRVAQLQKTYDVAGLTSDQLLQLLGKEFDRWKR